MSYLGPAGVIAKKNEYFVPCINHFYKNPPQFVKGEMQYLFDSEGKKYLDFYAGVSVMNCGHSNPAIINPVIDQIQDLQHVCNIYLTENGVNLAEKLAEVTPGDLKRTFFVNSGTEANEGALLMAQLYTEAHEFIALDLGLHGRTQLTMSLTGIGMWRTTDTPNGGIHFARNPYFYRDGQGQTQEAFEDECVADVARLIRRRTSGKIAAMIVEPIQGNAGIVTPTPHYFKKLKALLEAHNILLIVDEVQTGFGRTGKMFAIENFGIVPDIMTVAKALGNGFPIGAYITTDKIAAAFTRPSASTLGGNPVSTMAGLSVLTYLEEAKLLENANARGEQLQNGLRELATRHSLIGDVRGLGLMVGAELVTDRKTLAPAADQVDVILEKMKDRGILVGKNGENRNVLAMQPPLVITEEDVAFFLQNLDEVLTEVES
ncbi:aspartate aminotransferase family protein [Enterococcus diestrammenae]|uniref:alanine--glyoxylate transaminase n=1 Tax=Enterococcus diestrammenae TaxID=1155073 RepID=A0ABV0F4H3_9ENTE|nr:aspartate aminotransferase family protein [Enterococcus diestrammenae]KAF1296280.1 aminotransferase class III [Enterococcus diestrammenae]